MTTFYQFKTEHTGRIMGWERKPDGSLAYCGYVDRDWAYAMKKVYGQSCKQARIVFELPKYA